MMDIFDAADLLAIEQDAQSSSSSSSSSDSAANGSHKVGTFHEMQHPSHDGFATKKIADVDDDSSSEDGFLATHHDIVQQTLDDNELHYQRTEGVRQYTLNNKTSISIDESENVAIHLGESVVRWITSHQISQVSKNKQKKKQTNVDERSICTYDGVISIQNIDKDGFNNEKPSSARRLTVRNKIQRQSPGWEVTEATIEQFGASSGDTLNNRKRQRGQATLAPDAERANLGTIVDCLARYDPHKGAYVLEIVDSDVSGLTTMTPEDYDGNGKSEDDDKIAALTERPRATIADPRSRAKQAEIQLRKLKQGRGKR
ncbi:hypothetical protein ACHAXM_005804 [Skeletonema potamos]|jgi:hypothetical protein